MLGKIGHRLGRQALAEVATVARPDTILAGYRKLVAGKFDGSKARRGPGRPRVTREVEQLIVRMASENRDWGYDRIVGALANLGYVISDQTVGNILHRHALAIISRWHVDIRSYNDATYLHCESGLLFATCPERPGIVWQLRSASDGAACVLRDVSEHRAYDEWCMGIAANRQQSLEIPKALIGYAVVAARFDVINIAYERRRRGGCFIADFKDGRSSPNVDAPPLPPYRTVCRWRALTGAKFFRVIFAARSRPRLRLASLMARRDLLSGDLAVVADA
jgi:hypothetical protein